MIALSIVIFVFGMMIISTPFLNDVPKAYRQRQCMGRTWLRRFPESSKEDIRQFLWLFAKAFAIRQRNALLFSPNDELLAIYRAQNPWEGAPDALEFEMLANDVERIHGVSMETLWQDELTLGQLFEKLSRARRKAHA